MPFRPLRFLPLLTALPLLLGSSCGPGDEANYDWQPTIDEAVLETDTGWLLSIWGPAPDNLYAVGGFPSTSDDPRGVIMHWDGDAWTKVDIGIEVPLLDWVYGFGPDDITVVGDLGTIIHWNGSAWELQDTPTEQNLWGVWGAAPNDLWAVGGNGREDGDATILRYDGSAWTPVDLPVLERPRVYALYKVWGTSADNVYMVGQRGVVLHWTGTELVEELVGADRDLISLWGTGPDRIAAVGGRGNGVISTWNGTEWRTDTPDFLPGVNGVWMRSPDVLHFVGVDGMRGTVDFETLEVTEDPAATNNHFHGIFGDSSGHVTAVGGSLQLFTSGPYTGIAARRLLKDSE